MRTIAIMRLLSVLLVLSVGCVALGQFTGAAPADLVEFDAWRFEHGKVYGSEEGLRRKAFAANVARYTMRNTEEGQHGARFGPDVDSDMTLDEIKKRSCFTPSAQQPIQVGTLPASLSSATIDWRAHGAVTPVQQQHPFGTCWAFAATAALEGIAVVQGKQPLQKLSEQQLISCSPAKDAGQDSPVLWQFLKDHTHGSLSTEETYPYNRTCNSFREQLLAPDGTRDGYMQNCTLKLPPPNGPCPPCPGVERRDGAPKCQTLVTNSHAKVSNWSFVGSAKDGSDDAVVAALLKYGPGTLGIDATCVTGYKSGVITKCPSKNVDHAVTLVGAGNTAAGIPYWIVKNSWNTTFGDNGYFRVERNKNMMGINGATFGCFSPGCSISLDEAVESVVV